MIKSYLENHLLVYDTEEGPKHYQITRGVPHSLVLGPSLWNIMYGDMLQIKPTTGAEKLTKILTYRVRGSVVGTVRL